jgi:hypothetical protein
MTRFTVLVSTKLILLQRRRQEIECGHNRPNGMLISQY